MFPRWLTNEQKLLQVVKPLIEPLVVFGIALAVSLVIRYLVLRAISRRESNAARVIFGAVRLPSLLWCLAVALKLVLVYAKVKQPYAGWAGAWIGGFVILSLALAAASIAVSLMTAYGESQGVPFASAGLSRALVRVVVLGLGAMALLANFGIALTGVLATLGVGGIAVALALQDTLANLFAGIHILVERPIAVGNNLRLENGLEGVVTDIGWRTTRMRTSGNDMVVVPNTKITSGILVNFSLPEPRAVAQVAILTAHEADPGQVCRIAVEEAGRVDGVLETPAPVCLCEPGVLPTHVQYKLLFGVAARLDQNLVQSDVRLRILRRCQAEGVPLPAADIVRAHADRR